MRIFNREVLDCFLAGTLDRSLAETGVLDFKFKFVPVAACRTQKIDSDLHAFRAVLGRWMVANSAFCDRPAAQILHSLRVGWRNLV